VEEDRQRGETPSRSEQQLHARRLKAYAFGEPAQRVTGDDQDLDRKACRLCEPSAPALYRALRDGRALMGAGLGQNLALDDVPGSPEAPCQEGRQHSPCRAAGRTKEDQDAHDRDRLTVDDELTRVTLTQAVDVQPFTAASACLGAILPRR
jgi:hypothetical protein